MKGMRTMARNLTKEELEEHKKTALHKLEKYLNKLISDPSPKVSTKADKLSYWIEDWSTFLDFESSFSPSSLRRYKHGEIVKAHLGYNIGSEEGGLHYCVVIDKNNSIHSPVITVVPLTSVKKKTDLNHLHKGCIYLGNELFTSLISKISFTERSITSKIAELTATVNALPEELSIPTQKEHARIDHELQICSKNIDMLARMKKEVVKMKIGSIALVGQIRTISKIRIYDPKTNFDILSKVKLSNEKLDLIDQEIINNFTGINIKTKTIT